MNLTPLRMCHYTPICHNQYESYSPAHVPLHTKVKGKRMCNNFALTKKARMKNWLGNLVTEILYDVYFYTISVFHFRKEGI